jgi:hypothetical protein
VGAFYNYTFVALRFRALKFFPIVLFFPSIFFSIGTYKNRTLESVITPLFGSSFFIMLLVTTHILLQCVKSELNGCAAVLSCWNVKRKKKVSFSGTGEQQKNSGRMNESTKPKKQKKGSLLATALICYGRSR